MRILFVIPHYAALSGSGKAGLKGRHASLEQGKTRVAAIRQTVASLQQTFGPSQAMIRHVDRRTEPANSEIRHEVHVVIVTSGDSHVLGKAGLSDEDCFHFSTDEDPTRLGYRCHEVLRDRWGNYDYYGYLEDDLSIGDPLFFDKLRWFQSCVGQDKLLLPNRYERAEGLAYAKCYLDGELAARVTEPFQDVSEEAELSSRVMGRAIRFVRPRNPHSGCFFLNAQQMRVWIDKPYFAVRDSSFIGPLESAATLGIMKTFKIYKPAPEHAGFFEIEHYGCRFMKLIRTGNQPNGDSRPESPK